MNYREIVITLPILGANVSIFRIERNTDTLAPFEIYILKPSRYYELPF